jgi:prepilin-type N-terminal cleavage/methylation domain-containing protein
MIAPIATARRTDLPSVHTDARRTDLFRLVAKLRLRNALPRSSASPQSPAIVARAKPRRYTASPRHSSFILHPSSFPRAFTLVEIMVVIVILGLLAGMVLMALRGAQESARESKTRATITKLDNVIRTLYESYRTRRVPIDTSGLNPLAAATNRLAALRDLMRMEMPERKTDITNGPLAICGSIPEPAIHRSYFARLNAAAAAMDKNAPAECLYLIVTMFGGEDARAQFTADEIADTDGNGLYEFIDGWGHPIYFLRWAPGFNDSDIQANISSQADRDLAAQNDHDPFDARKADPKAWAVVPLIFSAGPDGQYGVGIDDVAGTYSWANDTYTQATLIGTPTGTTHYDNIHNHQAGAE